jgi:hypothetical protein
MSDIDFKQLQLKEYHMYTIFAPITPDNKFEVINAGYLISTLLMPEYELMSISHHDKAKIDEVAKMLRAGFTPHIIFEGSTEENPIDIFEGIGYLSFVEDYITEYLEY